MVEGGTYWRSVAREDLEEIESYRKINTMIYAWVRGFMGQGAARLDKFEAYEQHRIVWCVSYLSEAWTGIPAGKKPPHLVLWNRVSNCVTWHLYHRWAFQRELEDYCGT